jgi:hypothetical protein
MIKVTSVRNEETFAINEDYIIALYDVPDEDAKENALLLYRITLAHLELEEETEEA